jgi:glycosyltransferase involved in cell wall biosynthesis
MHALACGATMLALNTPPVCEMVRNGHNGLPADFFDVEALAEQANLVLSDPQAYRPLGQAAVELIRERYSLEVSLPRMLGLDGDACHARR